MLEEIFRDIEGTSKLFNKLFLGGASGNSGEVEDKEENENGSENGADGNSGKSGEQNGGSDNGSGDKGGERKFEDVGGRYGKFCAILFNSLNKNREIFASYSNNLYLCPE